MACVMGYDMACVMGYDMACVMERHGVWWHGMVYDGMEWCMMVRNGTG